MSAITSQQPTTRNQSSLVPAFAGIAVAAAVLGYLLPDRTVGAGMGSMPMTHYMGLLSVNQPWNLLMFMAAPVILAETLAITELVLLFSANPPAWVPKLSRFAGLVAGPLMVGIAVHLLRNAVIPLTTGGGWRGPADVLAVLSYLLAAIPLIGITLVELGVIGRDAQHGRKLHTVFVGAFLVVAHVAMIFGMLDPTVLGWSPAHVMPGGATMPGMNH
ncbi:DUF6803 family protein [Arsenicicoccus sp. oral taxon 190]|uniref:DUF6803 family protein n=1 Tax=Arsenicicoccus sp. oral taxon 190 TaxID=1658671 RepID=UPI00067A1217|nr:DUF6803 family protein [Arsenicicoccus sp. oral taxon 190]AKT50720.1 hypothetical protein ADJ73_04285 [Arsenicicoccus sp. oral taxon 190]